MNEHAIMVILISQPIVQWRAQERICRDEEGINQVYFISEKKVEAGKNKPILKRVWHVFIPKDG